jgi:hypothetical protein
MAQECDLRCYIKCKIISRTHTSRFKACMHQKFLRNNHTLYEGTILYTYFDLWTICSANWYISINIFHQESFRLSNDLKRMNGEQQHCIRFEGTLKIHRLSHHFELYLLNNRTSKFCNINAHKLSFMLQIHRNQTLNSI